MLKGLICLVALLATFAAALPGPSLLGYKWKLTELNGKPAVKAGTQAPNIFLNPKKGILVGFSGVNQFSGHYTLTKGSLSLDPGMSTLIGGPKNLMDQEAALHKALQATRDYRIVKNELQLLGGKKILAKFRL